MTPDKFSVPMRLMHWLMAVCILGMIASGWYMAGLDSKAPNKYDLYPLHKSFGVLLLGLIVLRIAIRLLSRIPELPSGLPGYEKLLARIAHLSLYVLMLLLPLSGLLMSDFSGRDVYFFGLKLPDLFATNKDLGGWFHSVHVLIPYILLGVVAVHILGALKHRFMDKPENDVLNKMLWVKVSY